MTQTQEQPDVIHAALRNKINHLRYEHAADPAYLQLSEAALAVIDMHVRQTSLAADTPDFCAHCEETYPCSTLRAFTTPLNILAPGLDL